MSRVGADHHDDVGRVLHERAEALLALTELGLAPVRSRTVARSNSLIVNVTPSAASTASPCTSGCSTSVGAIPSAIASSPSAQRRDAHHDRGTSRRAIPTAGCPRPRRRSRPIASIGPHPIAYITAVIPNVLHGDARPQAPAVVAARPRAPSRRTTPGTTATSSAQRSQIGVGAIRSSRRATQNTGTTIGQREQGRVDEPRPQAGSESSTSSATISTSGYRRAATHRLIRRVCHRCRAGRGAGAVTAAAR